MKNLIISVWLMAVLVACAVSPAAQAQIDYLQEQRDALSVERTDLQDQVTSLEEQIQALQDSGDVDVADLSVLQTQLQILQQQVRAYFEHDEALQEQQKEIASQDRTRQVEDWTALIGGVLGTGLLSVFGMQRFGKSRSQDAVKQQGEELRQVLAWIQRYGGAVQRGLENPTTIPPSTQPPQTPQAPPNA